MNSSQSLPGYQPDSNFRYSPLCTTPEAKLIYENGKRYDQNHRSPNVSIWTSQINSQRKNSLSSEPYISYVHAMELFSMYTDSLEKYLEGGENGIPFHDQLKDMRQSMNKTFSELVSGKSPDLNSLIENVVLRKMEEMSPKGEVIEQKTTTIPAIDRITDLMLRAELIHYKTDDVNERNQQIQAIFKQIEAINKDLKMDTSEYKLIEQTILLFKAIYPQPTKK
jgi:hypothetical protein